MFIIGEMRQRSLLQFQTKIQIWARFNYYAPSAAILVEFHMQLVAVQPNEFLYI